MRIGRPLPVASRSLAGQSAPERHAAGEVGCAPHDLSLCPRGCKIRSMMKGSMMFPRNGTDASGRRCEMSVNAGCIRISPLCDTDPCLARRPDSGSGLRRLRRILSAFCLPPPSVPVSLLSHRQTAGAIRRGMRSGKRPGCISAGRKRSEWPTHAQFLHLFPNIPVFCDRSRSWSASVGPLRSGGAIRRPRAVRCGSLRSGKVRHTAAGRGSSPC